MQTATATPSETFILFAIVDTNFNEVVEEESCTAEYRNEIRREMLSRRKDWGEGHRLFEIPGCFSRDGKLVIPSTCKLMLRTQLPPFIHHDGRKQKAGR